MQLTDNPPNLIARGSQITALQRALIAAERGSGNIICIAGEIGYGKTALCSSFIESIAKSSTIDAVHVECAQPMGGVNIGLIQPMQPFVAVLEQLMKQSHGTAKKKLAMNIGLTMLGVIPFAGEVFNATKEIMRDMREYKRDLETEQSTHRKQGSNSPAVEEFYKTIEKHTEQRTLVMILDGVQWMDAQSVEVLSYFLTRISRQKILLVVTYQRSVAEAQNKPFVTWLSDAAHHKYVQFLELSGFKIEQIREMCKEYLPAFKDNAILNEWLLHRTAGIPSTVHEYLTYFQRTPPFHNDGTINTELLSSNAVPATLQIVFAKRIEHISEDDRNLLGLCSAEGKECTVLIISQLLGVDILTTIKRLKSLQLRTGLIRSTGAHSRYGERTTVYEFTQGMYYGYFHDSLEYEEKVEIHARISAILKDRYNDTQNEELRRQLAPYIAAHTLEAGDVVSAQEMLLESAKAAQESGSSQVVEAALAMLEQNSPQGSSDENSPESLSTQATATEIEEILFKMNQDEDVSQTTAPNEASRSGAEQIPVETAEVDTPDVNIVREDIIEYFLQHNYALAIERIEEFLEYMTDKMNPIDVAMLRAMAVRAYTEQAMITNARESCLQAQQILAVTHDPHTLCYLKNAEALLEIHEGDLRLAWTLLQSAAHESALLTDEMKLLTMTNVSHLLHKVDARQANSFRKVALSLASNLGFTDFAHEALQGRVE